MRHRRYVGRGTRWRRPVRRCSHGGRCCHCKRRHLAARGPRLSAGLGGRCRRRGHCCLGGRSCCANGRGRQWHKHLRCRTLQRRRQSMLACSTGLATIAACVTAAGAFCTCCRCSAIVTAAAPPQSHRRRHLPAGDKQHVILRVAACAAACIRPLLLGRLSQGPRRRFRVSRGVQFKIWRGRCRRWRRRCGFHWRALPCRRRYGCLRWRSRGGLRWRSLSCLCW